MTKAELQAIRDWHGNGGDTLAHELVGKLLAHIDAPQPAPTEPVAPPRRRSRDK